jgi:hypothetical protein
VDPAWNTIDNQAVDRVYRIGQKRNVVVYRLITCGTIGIACLDSFNNIRGKDLQKAGVQRSSDKGIIGQARNA